MISDFDRTLEKLLEQESGTPLPFDLSFAMPKKDFIVKSTNKNTLNCYLYDISEDRELRSVEPLLKRQPDGTVETTPAPARIKLSYCITAWSPVQTTQTIEPELDEHRLLSQVLVALLKYPVLPPNVLVGELAKQEPPISTFVAMPNDKKSTSEFWNAIGGQLRPSLDYTVTISLDYQSPIKEGRMVTTLRPRYGVGADIGTADEHIQGTADERIQIGGFITDNTPASKPIDQAWVVLTESGQPPETSQIQITDKEGHFTFSRLKQGTYNLGVRADSYGEGNRVIEVPSPTGEYNVRLQPS
jgi:Pvc16 N-terminal domain/Carboxypeptidase regulatory-like domain